MSELLLRGWNVAVPVVDVGDDVFVIDDNDKTTRRIQVKSSRAQHDPETNSSSVSYTISRTQLRTGQEIELYYMLMVRERQHWRYFVIARIELARLHSRFVKSVRSGPGRRPKTHDDAKTDSLTMTISLGDEPRVWGVSLTKFESWPDDLPELADGPGRVRRTIE
jgi:hypothetical protein